MIPVVSTLPFILQCPFLKGKYSCSECLCTLSPYNDSICQKGVNQTMMQHSSYIPIKYFRYSIKYK
jgi:hypothetical protein